MKTLAYDAARYTAIAIWGCAAAVMIASYLAFQQVERLLEMEP